MQRLFTFGFMLALMTYWCEAATLGVPLWVNGKSAGEISGAAQTGSLLIWRAAPDNPLTLTFNRPANLSECDSLFLRIHSPQATRKGRLIVKLNSGRNGSVSQTIPLNFSGWKSFSEFLNRLKIERAGDLDWVTSVELNAIGCGDIPLRVLDWRFTPKKIVYNLPDNLPPPSHDTYWPEYVSEEFKTAVLAAPDFKDKLEELDRLRAGFAPPEIKRKHPKNFYIDRVADYWRQVAPDGSIADMDESKIRKFEIETKSPRVYQPHEGVTRWAFPRLNVMLGFWRDGFIEKSPENRAKLISALNYYLAYELNRKGEKGRWVSTAFHAPGVAAKAYFVFLPEMTAVENGTETAPELIALNQLCKAVATLAFTQPETGLPGEILTVEQFRHNGQWVGGNFGYRDLFECALVCRNPAMLDVVADVAKKALSVTSYNTRDQAFWPEGLTADGSGWGHGLQNYIFRYPADGLRTVAKTLARLKNSRWGKGVSQEQYKLAIGYLKTALWYCWEPAQYGPTMLLNERWAMRYRPNAGFIGIQPIVSIAKFLYAALPDDDSELRREIDNILAIASGEADEVAGCRYFWNNDDMISRDRDYFVGINMFSRRASTCEVVGTAGHYTDFLGDGSTFIMKTPDTYTVGKGFWKPTAIPGVTARQSNYRFTVDNWGGWLGLENFAGGVTDGQYGVCGFIYAKKIARQVPTPQLYGVRARKSYFCFGPELVCLGSGITDTTPLVGGNIETTIDNTELKKTLEYSIDGGKTTASVQPGEEFEKSGAGQWMVFHNGVGYIPLEGAVVTLTANMVKERWLLYDPNFNKDQKDRPTVNPMLRLAINHGVAPKDEKYAYMVNLRVPSLDALIKYAKNSPLKILANTTGLQAVRHDKLQITQAVFFSAAAELDDAVQRWKVSEPAVLMIRELPDGGMEISAADPEQKPQRQGHENLIVTSVSKRGNHKRTFTLPLLRDPMCGATVKITVPR